MGKENRSVLLRAIERELRKRAEEKRKRTLEVASRLVDDAKTITKGIGLEVGARGPREATGVVDGLSNGSTDRAVVFRGTTEKLEGDLGRGGIDVPGDGVRLASGNDLWCRR